MVVVNGTLTPPSLGKPTLILSSDKPKSHTYIYWLDYWRVLCGIYKVGSASMDVDWWGCRMTAPIAAIEYTQVYQRSGVSSSTEILGTQL